ncbi:MAG TPA: ANTAR domain-containing protein [Bryobacteraceae bacterium]|nr:ANTAR domain-containing protein [Bryobacteraceae bacterium]
MKNWESRPFRDSLSALALMGTRWASVDGYAFFEKSGNGLFRRLTSCGLPIPDDLLDRNIVQYPLPANTLTEGVVAFAIPVPPKCPDFRERLDQVAEMIRLVWGATESIDRGSELVDRVRNLEAQLLDAKIADRVRGLLENREDSDFVTVIAQHVQRVLRPPDSRRILEKALADLEEELAERHTTALAKTILRSKTSMTEGQAHAYLRTLSRRSRRRLKDVAMEIIEQQNDQRRQDNAMSLTSGCVPRNQHFRGRGDR